MSEVQKAARAEVIAEVLRAHIVKTESQATIWLTELTNKIDEIARDAANELERQWL